MTAPRPHNLDFPVTPASEAPEHRDDQMGVYTQGGTGPVGQGVNTSPRSDAENSRAPL